jgi:hypothetical protein
MKKYFFGVLTGFIVCTMFVSTFAIANTPIKLIVNGNLVESDVPPQIISGRTMIPARPLAEALGAKVEWDAENNAVVVTSIKDVCINTFVESEYFMPLNMIIHNNTPYLHPKHLGMLAELKGLYVEYYQQNNHPIKIIEIEGIVYDYTDAFSLDDCNYYYSIELLPVSYKIENNILSIYWIHNR